jgi:hypothetical protein
VEGTAWFRKGLGAAQINGGGPQKQQSGHKPLSFDFRDAIALSVHWVGMRIAESKTGSRRIPQTL